MGLKGYRLWAMGQLDSTCRAPPSTPPGALGPALLALMGTPRPSASRRRSACMDGIGRSSPMSSNDGGEDMSRRCLSAAAPAPRPLPTAGGGVLMPSRRCVALQVAYERQILKPDFHLIGYRLWF
jgi:hypothetical protein